MPAILGSMTPRGEGFPIGVMAAGDFVPGDPRRGVYLGQGEGHRLIIGPPGSGKFTSVIAPLLLTADRDSAIVFDVANGEAARQTGRHRASLGPIFLLDPFLLGGAGTHRLNPLDILSADDPSILTKARRLADALMIFGDQGGESQYWNDQATNLMVALLLYVATDPSEEGNRTLKRVRQIIRQPLNPPVNPDDPWDNGSVLAAMRECRIADNYVRDEVASLTQAEAERNTMYVQLTLKANTAFLDLPEVQNVTSATTIDLSALRREVATLYVVVPEYELATVARWLRLLYSVVMEQMRLIADAGNARRLHVIMDEFPALGRFPRVKSDMALTRKWGINFHVAVQSLEQLQAIYRDGWQEFCGVSMYQQVLGANDLTTAKYVSDRLGTTTRPTTSESHDRRHAGGSRGQTRSWQEAPLMAPHQVTQMARERCVVLVEGSDPLSLRKWHYFEDPYLQARASRALT